MLPHTLPVLAAVAPVASGAAGTPATGGGERAGPPGTFARVLDAASADAAPEAPGGIEHRRGARSMQARAAATDAGRPVPPRGWAAGAQAASTNTPALASADAGKSLLHTETSAPDPTAAPAIPPVDRPGTAGAPATESTLCTAPAAGDDSVALLAELHARHAPRAAPAELERPVVQPGSPSPSARLATSAPLEDRPTKTPRPPSGSNKAVPAPERKQTTATIPAGPSTALPIRNEVELPAPMAAPTDMAIPARVGTDPVEPPAGTLTLAPSAPADSEAGMPPTEPKGAAAPRVSDPYRPALLNKTGPTPQVPQDREAVMASQGPVERTSLPPFGDGPATQPPGSDTAAMADRPPTPAVPMAAGLGEPTTQPIEFGQAGFALPALAPFSAPSSAPPAATAAPLAEGRLAASPGSAEFGSQLGAQLTTFVRDGIQHARLHLHPAELGPVTVRIQIDGQAAQVHLAADNAFTRQALEQSMPQLAGSLREAGLTLSGGGVFEQPRHRGDDAPGQPTGGPRRNGGDAPAVESLQRPLAAAPTRRGVVDLVA